MNRQPVLIIAALLWFCLAARPLPAAETVTLAGEWRFALDRKDVGANEHWFAKSLPDKIQLPGVLESQGYGDAISIHTPWVLSLYDHFWYLRADYAADTNAGSVKVPFLCQPPRHYLGAAWYQRDIVIPANWSGKRIVLFLERPHWKSTVWLDDKEIGSDISLCTPHEYDFGLVPPGKHRLTIRVDNRMILPYRPDAHSVSDSLDDAWNGIVGKIELRATPPVWIDNVQIFPNLTNNSVLAKIRIGNITGKAGSGTIWFGCGTASSAETDTIEKFTLMSHQAVAWNTNGLAFDLEFSPGDHCPKWDEFHPNLRELFLRLKSNSMEDEQSYVFGLRNLHTDGNQFILNGRPLYLRGTHFGGDFPLTGYPATDVASWKKIIQTCKDYGLNHIRFHSWCPPEAAFKAADELGFYLQVEPGMWNSFSPGGAMEKQLYAETEAIIRAYGNHPSFLLFSASNEAHGRWQPVLSKWVKHFRAEDPRRLYTPDTGWSLIDSPDQPLNGGADYLDVGRIGPNRVRGESGWFGRDYGDSIAGVNVPVVAHEVGQWCAYPDFDVIRKFTGFMRPGNFEIFRDSAAAHGLLAQNHEFAQASGRFQLECYKEEIEANLRTPGLAGFQLLDLHDYTGQGTALVGLLDPFWESKGYVTPAEFKEFCRPVVLLARLTNRVFTTADKFEVPLEIANFGACPLTNAPIVWRIVDRNGDGTVLGKSSGRTIPLGKNIPLETISTSLAELPAPAQYKLVAYVQGTTISNEWNFWLYPAHIADAVPTNVFLTSSWTDAKKKLSEGGRVLFTPRLADLSWWSPPLARVPIFWNALMGPTWSRMLGLWCDTNSPALAEFPTEPNCDWQWTELVRNARAINLDHLPRRLKPIVSAIDDWNRNYKLGVIFEAKVGRGKLMVCSIDLNNPSPVAQQLRRSLLDYMADDQLPPVKQLDPEPFAPRLAEKSADKFQPQTEVSIADLDGLFFDNLVMRKLRAKAIADGQPANAILDGDPNTFWSSADARGHGPKPPHEILVSFPRSVAMNGLILMPRQNQREHQGDIRDYTIAASEDGTNWELVAHGQLASTFDPQTIPFVHPVTAKQLRLTALSGFGTDKTAALAELAVLYTGPKLPENAGKLEYRRVRTASPDIDAGDGPSRPVQKLSK